MHYTRLGRAGLRVSRLCLGTGALDIKLAAKALARLDSIFPGPRGPAPEAYAW